MSRNSFRTARSTVGVYATLTNSSPLPGGPPRRTLDTAGPDGHVVLERVHHARVDVGPPAHRGSVAQDVRHLGHRSTFRTDSGPPGSNLWPAAGRSGRTTRRRPARCRARFGSPWRRSLGSQDLFEVAVDRRAAHRPPGSTIAVGQQLRIAATPAHQDVDAARAGEDRRSARPGAARTWRCSRRPAHRAPAAPGRGAAWRARSCRWSAAYTSPPTRKWPRSNRLNAVASARSSGIPSCPRCSSTSRRAAGSRAANSTTLANFRRCRLAVQSS